MTVPARSIDRKLEALAKRIAAEKRVPLVSPTQGLTSQASTPNNNVPLPRQKGKS